MTFKEFLNRQDDAPQSLLVKNVMNGMPVAGKIFHAETMPKSLKVPKSPEVSASVKPVLPPGTMNGRRFTDPNRTASMPTKPTDFLARKNSSFRKGF